MLMGDSRRVDSTDISELSVSPVGPGGKCEPLNADILQLCSDIGYNETRFPNFMKHKSQQEAALETALYLPLVRLNCSPSLKRFLCSLYAPPCIPNYQQPLKPCREMCERAKLGCEQFMKRFSFGWPDYIDCWRFPSVSGSEACVPDDSYVPVFTTTTSTQAPKLEPNTFLDNLSPQQQQLLLSSLTGAGSKSGVGQSGSSSGTNNYFQQLYAAAIAAAIAATSNTLQLQTPVSHVFRVTVQ